MMPTGKKGMSLTVVSVNPKRGGSSPEDVDSLESPQKVERKEVGTEPKRGGLASFAEKWGMTDEEARQCASDALRACADDCEGGESEEEEVPPEAS